MWGRHSTTPTIEKPQVGIQPLQTSRFSDIRKWFDRVDQDHNGRISAIELQQSLEDGGIVFSVSAVANLIKQFDRSNSGTLGLQEFDELHTFLSSVENGFKDLKAERDGRVSRKEVGKWLTSAGYKLEQPVFEAIMNRFDPSQSGTVGLQEYLALTIFLRSATATFEAYDPKQTGSVNLTFPQFLHAAVNSL